MIFDKQSFLAGLHTGLRLGRDPIGRNPPPPHGRYIWTETKKIIITETDVIPDIFIYEGNVVYPAFSVLDHDVQYGWETSITRVDTNGQEIPTRFKYTWYSPDPSSGYGPATWELLAFSTDSSELADNAEYKFRYVGPEGQGRNLRAAISFVKSRSYPNVEQHGGYYTLRLNRYYIYTSWVFPEFPGGQLSIPYSYEDAITAIENASPEPFITE
jgi:hypothetical protein